MYMQLPDRMVKKAMKHYNAVGSAAVTATVQPKASSDGREVEVEEAAANDTLCRVLDARQLAIKLLANVTCECLLLRGMYS